MDVHSSLHSQHSQTRRPNGTSPRRLPAWWIFELLLLTPTPISGGKHKDRAQALAPICDALHEGLGGQFAGPVHRLAIVVGPPRGGVDVDVLVIETQAARFDGIGNFAVQHAHPAHFGIVGNSNGANVVIGHGGHFARAPRPVSIRVQGIVTGHGISVVSIDVERGQRVLGPRQMQWVSIHSRQLVSSIHSLV